MTKSEALFERAQTRIPGGVNSPVRAFKAVGGTPRFMERSDGAYIFDADGNKYIDYVLSWGPMIMADISRQIIRHRSFSFQEFSQRYAESTNFEVRDCRMQDEKNRQNSIEAYDPELSKWWESAQQELIQKSKMIYQSALDHGIAKEQARAVLPEGNTETTLYMAGTLRSWIHYCKLRRANGTQLEHIKIADQCWEYLHHNNIYI